MKLNYYYEYYDEQIAILNEKIEVDFTIMSNILSQLSPLSLQDERRNSLLNLLGSYKASIKSNTLIKTDLEILLYEVEADE